MDDYSSMSVRYGKDGDRDWIVHNNIALARESEGLELDPETVRTGVDAVLADRGKGFYLLAESGGEMRGQLMITPEWSDWRSGYYWWIQSVYVLPTHRRQGVLRRLFEGSCTLAEKAGNVNRLRLYVDEFNESAQDSYRRLGMSPSHYRFFELALH